jgi:hypothetical protein
MITLGSGPSGDACAYEERSIVVPDSFIGYFTGAATAAGALIGLLFVAVSLRPESVLGTGAPAKAQAVAGSAFTALVNSFFVSLIALIPDTNLGYPAAVMALISLFNTFRLHRGLGKGESAVLQLTLALAAYLTQLVTGVLLAASPGHQSLVYTIAYVLVASFAAALGRAWSLMRGSHTAEVPETQLQET